MTITRLLSSICFAVALATASRAVQAQSCPTGFTPRFIVANSCGEDVWMMETPPGSRPAPQAQWTWFANISTTTNTLPNGGTIGGLLVKANSRQSICVPDKGAPGGNFRFYMGCPNNNQDPFDPAGCTIGSAAGYRASINTLFEPSFGCKPGLSGPQCAFNPSASAQSCQNDPNSTNCPAMPPADNFDVSAVDGFTIPVKVDAQPLADQTCSRPSTDAGMFDLASCPVENQLTIYSDNSTQQGLINSGINLLTVLPSGQALQACSAPYKWMQTPSLGTPSNPAPSPDGCNPGNGTFNSSCFYSGGGCDASDLSKRCPNHSGPQQKVGPNGDGTKAIQNTGWVQDLYALGYNGYTWQYGDGVGDQACGWGTTITLTLCPRGGVPFRTGQVWQFSETTGACSTDGTITAADGQTTFASLADCQYAKSRYTCDDLSASDSLTTPSALWKSDTAATTSGRGLTWTDVQSRRRLVCQTKQFSVGDGNLNLPECNYVYTSDDSKACPSSGLTAPSPLPAAFDGQGRATGVGSGRANGELRIAGRFILQKPINFSAATIHFTKLLDDAMGRGELVAGRKNNTFLPKVLKPVVNWDGRRTIFESDSSDPNRTRLMITRLDGHRVQYEFALSIERAHIAQPVPCAEGEESIPLATSFGIQKNDQAVTTVRGTLQYACKAGVLVAKPSTKDLPGLGW